MSDIYPNSHLEDFWKTLWHVDVKKDHKNEYDTSIVNKIIYNNTYTTDQQISGKWISLSGKAATNDLGKVITFEDLFRYLTTLEFSVLSTLPIGTHTNITLNPLLKGESKSYDIMVFDDPRNGTSGAEISKFINHNMCLFVDTSSHLSELISSYKSIPESKDILYAHTREIESDPADKITYLTLGDKEAFVYEQEPPKNSLVITYPPYIQNDGLSYFYCKYPVFLRYDGVMDRSKYKLKVELSYKKEDRYIIVKEGANYAGAITKFKNGFKKLMGFKVDEISSELVFISKHHGDVAQSLVKFRNINLMNPLTKTEMNTAQYQSAFVSIDVNAIIKALSVDMPIIMMYPPAKDKIIVWKSTLLNNIFEQFESEKKYTKNILKKLEKVVKQYNENVEFVNNKNKKFLEISKSLLKYVSSESEKNNYINIIKNAVRISILSRFLPKGTEDITVLETVNINHLQDSFLLIDTPYSETQIATESIIEIKIKELKNLQKQIHDAENKLILPDEYISTILYKDNILVETSLEKDILLDFVEKGGKVTASLLTDSKKITNLWESIDLKYSVGEISTNSRKCRIATKLNISWGFDIIKFCYDDLFIYNSTLAKLFIDTLNKIVVNNKPTFKFGLELCGILGTESASMFGGGDSEKEIASLETIQNEEAVELPELILDEELLIKGLEIEVSDMIAHCELIINFNLNESKISQELELKKYIQKVINPKYELSRNIFSLNRFLKTKKRKSFGGNMSTLFDTSTKVYSTFSVIEIYERIVLNINHLIERLEKMRTVAVRLERISQLKKNIIRLNLLLDEIYYPTDKTWIAAEKEVVKKVSKRLKKTVKVRPILNREVRIKKFIEKRKTQKMKEAQAKRFININENRNNKMNMNMNINENKNKNSKMNINL